MKKILLALTLVLVVAFGSVLLFGCNRIHLDEIAPNYYYEQGAGEQIDPELGALLPDERTNTMFFLIGIAGATLLAAVVVIAVNVTKNEKLKPQNKD